MIYLLALALLFCPDICLAEGVIGVDTTFSIQPIQFLTSNLEYAQAFNYFFTIEIFVGLVALWLRWLMRVMRM